MELDFNIDKLYLLLRMLVYQDKKDNEITLWQNKDVANILTKKEYKAILDYFDDKSKIIKYAIEGIVEKNVPVVEINKAFEGLVKTDLFQKFYKENLIYMENVKNYWLKNQKTTDKFISETLRIKNLNIKNKVFISHPKFNVGRSLGNNIICFGHIKGIEDPNYNYIYLIHEILHSILSIECSSLGEMYFEKIKNNEWEDYWKSLSAKEKDEFNRKWKNDVNVIHAIIELATDNELYTQLSNESKYDVGHDSKDCDLRSYKKDLYPYWFAYLGLSDDEIRKRIGNSNLKIAKNEISEKLNIYDFLSLCLENSKMKN